MRTLGPADRLAAAPDRVAVAGVSGAGKTTLAARIAAHLGVPHVETDELHWGPGWAPRPSFVADVRAAVAQERWVMEWQYLAARPLIAARAQVLVWLDPPVVIRMARVVRRTVRRRLRREALWAAGNVEPPLRTVLSDPEHIVRWAWRTRHHLSDLPERLHREHPHLLLIRLRSAGEVEAWLARLPGPGGAPHAPGPGPES